MASACFFMFQITQAVNTFLIVLSSLVIAFFAHFSAHMYILQVHVRRQIPLKTPYTLLVFLVLSNSSWCYTILHDGYILCILPERRYNRKMCITVMMLNSNKTPVIVFGRLCSYLIAAAIDQSFSNRSTMLIKKLFAAKTVGTRSFLRLIDSFLVYLGNNMSMNTMICMSPQGVNPQCKVVHKVVYR